MECLFTFVVLLIVLMVVTGSAARAQTQSARRRRMLQQAAKRFSGYYISGGIFARPGIRVPYGETSAVFKEASPRGPHARRSSEIQIHWPDGRFRLEVFRDDDSEGLPQRDREFELGVADFDRDYVVRGGNPQEARNFLSEGVRWQLHRIRLLLDDDRVYLLVHRGRLILQKPARFQSYDDLQQFIEHALELYDQAMLTQARGIEFIDADMAQPLEEVICKVCGESILDSMVYCHRCKTPHHAECWHYNGACSVYGCLETRFLAPQTVEPVNKPHGSQRAARPR